MNSLSYSNEGLALTKQFEGLRLTAYQDQGGIWTIGYGHTGPHVYGGLTITEGQAELLLESDIAGAVQAVNRAVTAPVTQNQFDALVDFVFNLGPASLLTSTLLRDINAGRMTAAAPEFLRWDHCRGQVLPGLRNRRLAEMELFQHA